MLHHADVCLSGAQLQSLHNWTFQVTFAPYLSDKISSFDRGLFLQ